VVVLLGRIDRRQDRGFFYDDEVFVFKSNFLIGFEHDLLVGLLGSRIEVAWFLRLDLRLLDTALRYEFAIFQDLLMGDSLVLNLFLWALGGRHFAREVTVFQSFVAGRARSCSQDYACSHWSSSLRAPCVANEAVTRCELGVGIVVLEIHDFALVAVAFM
jgi:hypothetical protein